jgi:molybdate transport system ATP-binding protein
MKPVCSKLDARIVKRFPPASNSAPFTLDVKVEADPGISILFGASGAGKTLTLDCIAGFAHPDSGRILLGGRILFDADARVNIGPQGRECGYVFQNYALFPHMTLRENLAFAAERRPRLDRHRRVSEMINRFHLADIAGQRPAEVSGGQRQRCSIARALIAAPQVLLFDEPTRGLDAGLRSEFYSLLRDLRKELDIPLVIVTHDLDEAVALGDRMLVYEGGRIVQRGVPQDIISRPATANVARLLGHTNLLSAEIIALDPGRNTSRLRLSSGELHGVYFPGHLIGDQVTLAVRADELRVHSDPVENGLPLRLEKSVDHAHAVELHFFGGITALVPRYEFASRIDVVRDWYVEVPGSALRILGAS